MAHPQAAALADAHAAIGRRGIGRATGPACLEAVRDTLLGPVTLSSGGA